MIKEMIITYDTDDADSECDAPILKRQELVRCRDCVHWKKHYFLEGYVCKVFDWIPAENDFCSFAERKTE